jgi:hypothetical protein
MAHPTSKTHKLVLREPALRVSDTDDARRQALDWIADQLRWKRTLDALRARNARQ